MCSAVWLGPAAGGGGGHLLQLLRCSLSPPPFRAYLLPALRPARRRIARFILYPLSAARARARNARAFENLRALRNWFLAVF